ncbi:MAG: fabG, partial [Humibacillus sp.]|nr:fabG [Humibacillus sp.]
MTGLVLSHCESVDSDLLTTSLESWDRHYAVNARSRPPQPRHGALAG